MQQTLWDCVSTRWQPGINDPFFLSWVMVAIYVLAAVLAVVVARRAPFPAATRRREKIIWITVAGVVAFMAVNKQEDLQTLILAAGSCVVRTHGWYEQTYWLKGLTMVLLALLALGIGAVFLWSLRGTSRRTALPLLGLALMAGFVAFRAAETLQVLGPLRALARGYWTDRVLELSGPAVIIVAALLLLRLRGRTGPPRALQ